MYLSCLNHVNELSNVSTSGGARVDDLPFLDYLSPFCFLLIKFHCTFSISYKILPYYFLLLLYFDKDVIGRRDLLFFRARFASFRTHASLLSFFVYFFLLFRSCCSHARVFGKTLVHEFIMSYSHTEWYLPFLAR